MNWAAEPKKIETRSLLQRRKLLPTELTFKVASTDLEMESRATDLEQALRETIVAQDVFIRVGQIAVIQSVPESPDGTVTRLANLMR